MNKTTAFLVIVITALSFILGATVQSKAQNKSFAGVIPFMSNSSRLGFLDQSNGRVYIYDDHFSQCVFVGQIKELGQAIQIMGKSQ